MVDQYGRWYPDYPGQQPSQDPAYLRAVGQPVPGHTQQPGPAPQQNMTPVIRTEMQQIKNMADIDNIPIGAGETRMFMTADEKNIVIRSVYANGQHSDRIYDERPPEPPAPKFDPSEYVRKDELEKLLANAVATRQQKAEGE